MSTVTTPEFRMSYPNVFKAKMNKMNGKEEYGVMALFPAGTDFSQMKAAAAEAMTEKFGANRDKWPQNWKNPFRMTKQDGSVPEHLEEGAIFMNFRSDRRPGLVDRKKQDILDSEEIYGGCWGRASVRAYAYDTAGNKGVSFGLNHLQKTRDDEAFGAGRVSVDDAFDALPEVTPEDSGGDSANSIF
jgi:hypothetical protein